mgnify:CR=1 FL=1
MSTIPELGELTSITDNDLVISHDAETNITSKVTGKNAKHSFHRFTPLIVTGSTLTLTAEHETALVVLTNATSTVVSIDDNVFPVGATIHILRDNSAGPVTIQALGGSTVVLRVPTGKLSQARDTNSPMTLYLREVGATEYWNIWGDLANAL